MDSNSSNNKPQLSFSESHSKDEKQFLENRRNQLKRNNDLECNLDCSSSKKREHSHNKAQEIFRTVQPAVHIIQQAAIYPSYRYNTADRILTDNRSHAFPIMSAVSTIPVKASLAVNMSSVSRHNVIVNQNQPGIPVAVGLKSCNANTFNPYSLVNNMNGDIRIENSQSDVPAKENLFSPFKQIIHLTKCVLYPPNLNEPPQIVRVRPLGCKTVFVGGCPEKITEKIVHEMFELCGRVQSIKMFKNNVCHVRFSDESFVANALDFSGYWMKIENTDEPPFNGILHVDYLQSREDLYDHECKHRALLREVRHQKPDNHRPPTPPVIHYTESEASRICEKLKKEENFIEAANVLITWLEKGECTKIHANNFYSMIQSTQNHVRKLQIDKSVCEDQLNKAKMKLKKQLECIIRHLIVTEKIYKAASVQKCWDQFTKAQRKNIELWKKQTEELKDIHLEEAINDREDEEMELSDNENENKTNINNVQQFKQNDDHVLKLKEELDSLKLQLKAAQNEKMVMISDYEKKLKNKDNEMISIREALQKSKDGILNLNQKCSEEEVELKKLHAYKLIEKNLEGNYESSFESNAHLEALSNDNLREDARLISLITTFLHAHPFGANINYICSYITQIDSGFQFIDVENLLKRYPVIFKEDSTGIGASLERKWYFTGF